MNSSGRNGNGLWIKWLSVEEVEKFFQAIEDYANSMGSSQRFDPLKYRTIFLLMYRYALRVTEATLLNVDSINLAHNTIRIERLKRGESKEYPLTKDIRPLLEKYLTQRKSMNGKSIIDALFLNHSGARMSHKGIRSMFKTLIHQAGIKGEYSTHCLRHSIAMHMLNDFADLKDVQDLLGHKSIQSTLEYAKMIDQGRSRYMRSLEEATHRGMIAKV